MQITVYAGGKTWLVDEANLIQWLRYNAIQKDQQIKEVVEDEPYMNDVRVLLNEKGISK
jgi:hypothetical protein